MPKLDGSQRGWRPLRHSRAMRFASHHTLRYLALAQRSCCLAPRVHRNVQVAETEQMLAPAGFQMQPADTPKRQAQLASLPPRRLMLQRLQVGGQDTIGYVYRDLDLCHCVFIGDAKSYQAFQQLAFQKRLADEHRLSTQMAEDAAFDWRIWGRGFWGPQRVAAIREGGHGCR